MKSITQATTDSKGTTSSVLMFDKLPGDLKDRIVASALFVAIHAGNGEVVPAMEGSSADKELDQLIRLAEFAWRHGQPLGSASEGATSSGPEGTDRREQDDTTADADQAAAMLASDAIERAARKAA